MKNTTLDTLFIGIGTLVATILMTGAAIFLWTKGQPFNRLAPLFTVAAIGGILITAWAGKMLYAATKPKKKDT